MKFSSQSTKVLILSHFVYNPFNNAGTSVAIKNHLLAKSQTVVHIEQPFHYSPERYSYVTVYKNGIQTNTDKIPTRIGPETLQYILHSIVILLATLRYGIFYDLCIACENLSYITVYGFKLLGTISKTVYYSVDYTPVRFNNFMLNKIYHSIDSIAYKTADSAWVVAGSQIKARKKNGLCRKSNSPQIVPICYRNKDIPVVIHKSEIYYRLLYTGGLSSLGGAQLALESMPLLIPKYPKIFLTIIGDGPIKEQLQNSSRKLGISRYVKFIGYITNHNKLVQQLNQSGIGLAPYAPIKNSICYYSDPSKIKLYLACGLPVVTTSVNPIWKTLINHHAGLICRYTPASFASTVTTLFNKKTYTFYAHNARKLASNYDIDTVLNKMLSRV